MEIEFSESQMEKVETLKANGISVGEAIDILFDIKDHISYNTDAFIDKRISDANREKQELQEKIDKIDGELSLFNRIKDNSLNFEQKQKIVENEYFKTDTYDRSVQDAKHHFKWSRKIFDL